MPSLVPWVVPFEEQVDPSVITMAWHVRYGCWELGGVNGDTAMKYVWSLLERHKRVLLDDSRMWTLLRPDLEDGVLWIKEGMESADHAVRRAAVGLLGILSH